MHEQSEALKGRSIKKGSGTNRLFLCAEMDGTRLREGIPRLASHGSLSDAQRRSPFGEDRQDRGLEPVHDGIDGSALWTLLIG